MRFPLSKNQILVGIIVLNIILFAANVSIADNPERDYLRPGAITEEVLRNTVEPQSLNEILNFDSDCLIELELGRPSAEGKCQTSSIVPEFSSGFSNQITPSCEEAETQKRKLEIQINELRLRSALTPDDIAAAITEKNRIMMDISKACDLVSVGRPLTDFQFSDDK